RRTLRARSTSSSEPCWSRRAGCSSAPGAGRERRGVCSTRYPGASRASAPTARAGCPGASFTPRADRMSEASPLVTVAMAMRDAARTLPAALASLLHQDYENWELVLIDDGSRDDSVKVAGRFADPRIRLLADGRRRGLGARLNEAVDAARGELIARMDADDISYASRFSRQVAFLQAHPEVDVVAAAMVVFAGTGEPVGLYRVAA